MESLSDTLDQVMNQLAHGLFVALGPLADDAVLQRPDQVDRHPVLDGLLAEEHALAQQFLSDKILRPRHIAIGPLSLAVAGGDGTA